MQKKSAQEIAKLCAHAVVKVRVFQKKKNGKHQEIGVGSGFFIRDGYIVTCAHVVSKPKKWWRDESCREHKCNREKKRCYVAVFDDSRRPWEVQLVGCDPCRDLALLRVKELSAVRYQELEIGDATGVQSGDRAYSAGMAFGVKLSVGEGIISCLRRDTEFCLVDENFETTALIVSGMSGGPLFDQYGRVIGVLGSHARVKRDGERTNLAISAGLLDIAGLHSGARTGYFGVELLPDDIEFSPWPGDVEDLAACCPNRSRKSLRRLARLLYDHGALVMGVAKKSPAKHGGVKAGDVIVKFGDAAVKTAMDVRIAQANVGVGKLACIEIMRVRKGRARRVRLSVTLS